MIKGGRWSSVQGPLARAFAGDGNATVISTDVTEQKSNDQSPILTLRLEPRQGRGSCSGFRPTGKPVGLHIDLTGILA